MNKYILFDLDGTLTDPKVGITKSVAYSLKKMHNMDVNPDDLEMFIGPPLKDSYMEFYGMTEDEAIQAIDVFREYFKEIGIFENEIYEGIISLLEELVNQGSELMIATSKPTQFAERVLEYFDIKKYFKYIVGSNFDGTRVRKSEVISEVFRLASITNEDDVIMVGDRKHDIIGANEIGIKSIGVVYGYGSLAELKEAGAYKIVRTVSGLKKVLTD